MKIVDRETFLTMPGGTVFSTYESPPSVGCFGDIRIKGETVAGVDFYTQEIVGAIRSDDTTEYADALLRAAKTGESIEMDFDYEGRDGMFDEHQLFAVWERRDVEALVVRLQTVLA